MEAIRGFAALYVLLHHVSSNYLHLKYSIWGFPFRFGLEAVLIFFILSGFVICYSHPETSAQGESFKSYFFKRTRRIYPIFILSIIVAQAVACVAVHGWAPVNVRQLFGNLFMVQNFPSQPGTFCLPIADNDPLWSLSFEWWFYMMFYPINRWVPRAAQKFLVLALCVAGLIANRIHPNSVFLFLIFFVIWWTGVELAHEFRKTGDVSFARQKSVIACACVPLLWYSFIVWQTFRHGDRLQFNTYPMWNWRYFFMTPVLLAVVFAWRRVGYAGFDRTFGYFRRLGSISFALYVFHFPIVCDLRLLPGQRFFYLDLALRICVVFFLAWLAEIVLQKWINRITAPLLVPRQGNAEPASRGSSAAV